MAETGVRFEDEFATMRRDDYFADLSDRTIATSLGISLNSVKKHLSRALTALRRDLEGGEPRAHAATPAG